MAFSFKNLFRRNLENPATSLANPAMWLVNMFGGITSSGVTITQDNSLGITAVWSAVNRIADNIATMKVDVVEELPSGEKLIRNDHPIAQLLREPSYRYTNITFLKTLQGYATLAGNGFAAIVRDPRTARPVEMMIVHPGNVDYKLQDGKLYYIINVDDKQFFVDSSEVIHIPGLAMSDDGIMGLSPIAIHRETLGFNVATKQYGNKLFQNGAHMSGYITTDVPLTADARDRVTNSFSQNYLGLSNAGKVPVLDVGMKFVPLSLSPDDAQFVESHKMSIPEVARIFNIPPHLIADLERSTFSNIEQLSREFVTYTLRPWIKQWEAELNRKLFLEEEKGRFKIRFNINSLLRGDTASQSQQIDTVMKWGIMSINEVRQTFFDMNPIDDEIGNKNLVPLNMVDPSQGDQNTTQDEQ
jgi:HK97 family phage portal protein